MDIYQKHLEDLLKIKSDCVVVLERTGYPEEYPIQSEVRHSFEEAKKLRDEWFQKEWEANEKYPERLFTVNIYLKDLCSCIDGRWEPDTFIPLY